MPESDSAGRAERGGTPPPDQAERERILGELDRCMLVEAAAGTGKTTSMIDRMVALLAEGICRAETLAAVTFTRKAAAELRARFGAALERAAVESEGPRKRRLERATADSARAFIGTIHSFCARLLRERPVEAGVDVDFQEIDEEADARLREFAWREFVASLYAEGAPILTEIAELGLEVGALKESFTRFADYPDVDEWPAEAGDPVEAAPAREALLEYARHMEELAPTLPDDAGGDKLIPKYRLIPRMVRCADLEAPSAIAEILDEFGSASVVQYKWPDGKEQAKEEKASWDEFSESFARPAVEDMRARRYAVAIRALESARGIYDRLRHDLGMLNYQDLLIGAAGLLRDRPHVRLYFRKRFTHLLVDEFQDTDPVQAEVMLLLTASDPGETDWRNCRPAGGALFVVGDPKQSIYRFRRADIVTYTMVKGIIERSGGAIVSLSANFRATRPVVDWVNAVFEGEFPASPTEFSPGYVALQCARRDDPGGELAGVRVLVVGEEYGKKDAIAEYEPPLLARVIRSALDAGGASPADFLIVTRGKKRLGRYAHALEKLGIPHRVTGGSALNEVNELRLLSICLSAVTEPDDPVALVAALRSELFGMSDAALYAFKRAGGEFSFNELVPEGLGPEDAEAFADAFARLKVYASWLEGVPPVAAVERIAGDLGLYASACAAAGPSGAGGDVRAGSLGKAVELLRAEGAETWSAADVVDRLARLANSEEMHDGVSARPGEEAAVRVMNLHKVKGLEAPVVFLADPIGEWRHPITIHVDRSGEKVRGYLALYGERRGDAPAPLLARPRDWAELETREGRFLDAEAQRLLYVAATRAGSGLVITQRAKGNHLNPWKFFGPHLEGHPELADPGPQEAPEVSPVKVGEDEPARSSEAIAARWAAARKRSYSLARAKEDARRVTALLGTADDAAADGAARVAVLPAGDDALYGVPSGEHGTEWGEVVHALLEAAMVEPGADLAALARAELAEHGMELSLADAAIETVTSVARSDIWRRAREGERRLVEVPFQMLLEGATPTVVRGVIDLAFREEGEWVIVDYKTDAADASGIPRLVERYRPQLRAYAEAWRRCVGEPVREAGIYFVRAGAYEKC